MSVYYNEDGSEHDALVANVAFALWVADLDVSPNDYHVWATLPDEFRERYGWMAQAALNTLSERAEQ